MGSAFDLPHDALEAMADGILIRDLADGRITFWNQGAVELYGFTRPEAIGQVSHVLLQTVFPEPREELERRLAAEGRWEGELEHTRRAGTRVIVSSRQTVLRSDRRESGSVLEVDRDVTAERHARDRLDAVIAVTLAILSGERADHVLDLIARRARELVGASLATIALPDRDGTLLLRVADGADAERVLGMRIPAERSLVGGALQSREPILVTDMAGDPRTNPEFLAATGLGSAIVVPLLVKDRALGTLLVANPSRSGPFGDDDLTIVRLFAAAASVAIDSSRGREALDRLLLVEDRQRIARELHDGAIQRLFAIGMSLQHTALLSREPQVSRRLEGDVAMLDRVIGDLRAYIFELRPDAGGDPRLGAAVRDLLWEFERVSGITAVLEAEVDEAAGAGRTSVVLELLGQALADLREHAHPATVRVSVGGRDDGAALVEVVDDAGAFDPEGEGGRADAVRALRERVDRLGGSLGLEPAAGTGIRLRIALEA